MGKIKFVNDKQKKKIESIMGQTSIWFGEDENDGLYVDDWISFDQMAEIVDHLRKSVDKNKELFEQCWVAYRRKGIKKKALDYWNKLEESEMMMVMAHIKAYVSTRELMYQKDFERYLRDKVFMTVVFANNVVVYDPAKNGIGEDSHEAYNPVCGGALSYNDYYNCYMYVGYWDGKHIADGYTDDNRPNGATIKLNNGRGTIVWSSEAKEWKKA